MPVPIVKPIHCSHCGKLLKTETYSDAMTPEDWRQYTRKTTSVLCLKCTVKKVFK